MLRLRPLTVLGLRIAVVIAAALIAPSAAAAVTITVDRTDDPAVTASGTGAAACTAASNDCSLRGATLFANANAGTTINVPAGTYQLTRDGSAEGGNCGDATVGDLDIAGNNTTITGAGAASTIIQQTTPNDRVICVDQFLVGNFNFSISGVTITGGRETFGVGGGGMISGDQGDTTTISNVVFSNNQASGAGSPIGGGLGHSGGSLTLNGVTFGGPLPPCTSQTNINCANSAAGSGGGAYVSANYTGCTHPCAGTFSITNSKFENNTSAGNGGGLIVTQGNSYTVSNSTFTNNTSTYAAGRGGGLFDESGTLSVDHSTFTGNQATGASGGGGAIGSSDGAGGADMTISFSRIVGNTSTAGASGVHTGLGNTTTETNNWWGCNGGPATGTGCDKVGGTGTSNYNPWIVLKTTASPSSIDYGASTTLTSSFLQNSSGGSLTASNVSQLIGLPVTWTASHGTLSNQQSTIQSNGTATSTFTAGATSADCGNVGASEAKVDSVQNSDTTATASITINCPDLTATLSNDVSGATTLGNSWTWTLTGANGGTGPALYANGQTILTDNLPNSNISYGSVSEQNVSGVTGTISCSINGTDDLTCTANGSVTVAAGGSITATFLATPSAAGSFVNPRAAGVCAIDPNNNIPETNDSNNSCSNTVTVTAPDLTVANSNNVAGSTTIGNSWTWKAHIANASANATATFNSGDTILTDQLDNSGSLSYGTPVAGNASNITNIGNVSCSISSSTLTCSATGPVTIGTSGSFDVTFTASTSVSGTYSNPRSGGTCAVDPNNVVPESNDGNNTCNTDSVTVTAPDLTATKTDDVGHGTTLGNGWNWTIAVANGGNAGATFQSGQTILSDDLPSPGVTYGAASATNLTGIGGTGTIQCGVSANTLTCSASGGTVTIAAGTGAFDVQLPATPTVTGTFDNPRSGGSCSVDPGSVVTESDETNNSCSDSVTVTAPDLTESLTDNAGGPLLTGQGFNWTLTTANAGNAAAVFGPGTTILQADLDNSGGVSYGTPTVQNVTNVTGSASIQCAINGSSTLTCTANGATVTIGAGTGTFDVVVPTTTLQGGTYTVPRGGGICRADPSGAVTESNESNNDCTPDSVTANNPTDLSTTDAGSPDPSVTAGSSGGTDNLTHTITLHNGGASSVSADVTVTLPGGLPTNTTLHTVTPSAGSYNSGTGVWSVSSLAAGASATLTLSFNVGAATANGATIESSATAAVTTPNTIDTNSSNDSSSRTTTVLQPPSVTPNPSSWDFGSQRVGVASVAKTFTITNAGGESLTVTGDAISGSGAGDFVENSQDCTTQSPIAPGHSCSISVSFDPMASGPRGNAAIHVVSNDPGGPTDIALHGTGVQPAVSASPTSKDFGSQRVGSTSAPQTFTITDTGTDALHVTTASLVGSDASQFVASGDTCTSSVVAVGHSCTVAVAFKPTTPGAHAASLRIATDAGNSVIALTGTGVSPSIHFTVAHIHVGRNGVVRFALSVPGQGVIRVLETASKRSEAGAASVLLQPAHGRFVFARGLAIAHGPGTRQLKIAPNKRGRRLVAHHRGAVRIRLWITFTPPGGRTSKQGFLGLFVTK